MRRMQRLLYESVSLIMAILFVLPFGVFFSEVLSFGLLRTAFLPCFAVLGHLAGRATLRSDINLAMAACGASAVIAALLTAILLPSLGLGGIFYVMVVALLCLFLYFFSRRAGYALYLPMSVGGILADLGILLIANMMQFSDLSARIISLSACAFFLLSLYAFNNNSLRRSLHKGLTTQYVHYPRGMKLSNFWLLTGFIVLAIFIANFNPLFRAFSVIFLSSLKILGRCLTFLSALFDRRSVSLAVEEESSTSTVSDEDNIYAYEAKGEAAIITTIVEIMAMILVVIVLTYLAYRAYVYLKSRMSGINVMGRMRKLFAIPEDEDYIDEAENLITWKELLANAGATVRENAKKLTQRPQKIDDFPDGRMKLRFVYKQLMKSISRHSPGCCYQTPNELQASSLDSDADVTTFIAAYNTAKYADQMPSTAEVDAARRLLKRKF